jgi:hypothetical protein
VPTGELDAYGYVRFVWGPTSLYRGRSVGVQLRRLVVGFPPRPTGFELGLGHVGFVVDKVALGQVFSEYFGFLCQFSFHRLLHIHHLSSGAGTIGQILADVPSGLSLTPPQEKELYKVHIRAVRKAN